MQNRTASPVKFGIPALWVWLGFSVFFLALFLRPLAAGDIWFLLLAGRHIYDTGAIPHEEFFIYSAPGAPQLFTGWGYGLLMETARRLGGLPGVAFCHSMLWTVLFLLPLLIARQQAGQTFATPFKPPEICGYLIAAVIVLYAAMLRTWFRPEVTMYILWFVGLYWFEAGRRTRNFKTALIVFPLLVWLEAWFHTAGLLMLILPLAFAGEEFHRLYRQERSGLVPSLRQMQPWLYSWLAALFLPLLNPNGIDQVFLHFRMFASNLAARFIPEGQPLPDFFAVPQVIPTHDITEFLPAWQMPDYVTVYFLLASTTFILLVAAPRRLNLTLQVIPLAAFAILHVRGAGHWGLVLFVPLIRLTHDMWLTQPAPGRKQRPFGIIVVILMCGLSAIGIARKGDSLQLPETTAPFMNASRAIALAYPEGGNIFTSHRAGAEIVWNLTEKYQVSFAAHFMMLHTETQRHYAQVFRAKPDWQTELDRYHVVAVVMETIDYKSGEIIPLPYELLQSENWVMAASDHDGLTFLRLAPELPAPDAATQLKNYHTYWQTVLTQLEETSLATLPLAVRLKSLAEIQFLLTQDTTQSPEQLVKQLSSNLGAVITAERKAAAEQKPTP